MLFFSNNFQGQAQGLSGTFSIPGNYSTIAAAVSALNTNGVGTGGATFNVAAGYTETLSAGISMTATGTSSNPIVFQKSGSGANPVITAFVGTQIASNNTGLDVMWSFLGSDYVTIDGINLQESSSNTTTTTMMETGYGFYKASATDGTNNNTVKNCTITLNRNNIASPATSGPRINVPGSCGIEFMACLPTAISAITTVSSASGVSSNNKVYSNTIQNVNFGIAFSGYAAASPYTLADANNDVGGSSSSTGNTIINFGGGTSATGACGAVFMKDQWSFNVSYNTVNNNTGSGVNHPVTNRGIFLFNSSAGASADVTNNTISIACGSSTTANNWCLDCEMATTGANGNTINLNNNKFLNCKQTVTNTAFFTAIWVNSAATTVNVNGNYIYGFTTPGTGTQEGILSQLACGTLNMNNNTMDSTVITGASGSFYCMANTAANTVATNIYGNTITRTTINNSTGANSNTLYGIYNSAATPTLNVYGNSVNTFTRNGTTGGTTIGIYCSSGTTQLVRKNNVNTLSITGTGTTSTIYGIQVAGTTVTCDSNTVYGLSCTKTTGTSALYGIYDISSPTNENFNYNTIYNLTHSGTGVLYGLYTSTTTGVRNVSYNTIYGLTGASTVTGILQSSSVPKIFNNKIYDLTTNSTTAVVSGIAQTSTTAGTCYIYNNLISRLNAPVSNGGTTFTVLGYNNTSSTASTTYAFYNNTINLSATSSGTNFSSACVYHTYSATATTAALDMRNNILVNNSTPTGTGIAAVFKRNVATSIVNISSNSNRNLYYAGTPSATHVIYADGTNLDQTLSAFQTRVTPRDSNSVYENPNFVSTTGSSSSFLRINPSIATVIESGGRLVSPVSTDYALNIRAGVTGYTGLGGSPDLGAYEEDLTGMSANNMTLDSMNADQITGQIPLGSSNVRMLRLRLYAQKSVNALEVTSFVLNTFGSTNVADISNIKVWASDSNSTFTNATLYGTVNSPNGQITVSGSKRLAVGVNYFWVTYDISSGATGGDYLDANFDNAVISGTTYTPINGSPSGNRQLQSPLNGTYYIGASQSAPNYTTITSALADLNALGVSGPVTFLLTDAVYNGTTGETFPLTFNAYGRSSTTNKLTLVPASGISSKIESSNSTTTIDLNGISNFTIDGRPQGNTGFTNGTNLIISNTSGGAPAIRFINDADSNYIIYTDCQSNNAVATGSAGAGVINFGVTSGTGGNDLNTIQYCDIHELSGGNPTVGISSLGSSTTVAANNDNNFIDHCNIYNYFSSTLATAGLYIGSNNGSWTISNNHVYQTAALTTSAAVAHRGMWITPNTGSLTSASGFIITNNYIGGSAANGTGTMQYTINSTTGTLLGMDVSVGLGTATSVQGNTITNMGLTTIHSGSASFVAVKIANGKVDVGTVTGNYVGTVNVPGSVSINSAPSTSSMSGFIGFQITAGTGLNIYNNHVTGISISGTYGCEFFGFAISGGTNIIANNNVVGDSLIANSIVHNAGTTGVTPRFCGMIINPQSVAMICSASNNLIANMTSYHLNAQVKGIHMSNTYTSTFTINNNLVYNLIASSKATGAGASAAIGGIIGANGSATGGSYIISGNTVHSLISNATGGATTIYGIVTATPTSGTNSMTRNFVHSLSQAIPNDTAIYTGIEVSSGNSSVLNNMVRLGIDSAGNSISSAPTFKGLVKGSGSNSIYFNTIYIGGAVTNITGDTNRTYAFVRTTAGTDDVRNNIFYNERTNGSGMTARHMAVSCINNTTLTMDYNLLKGDSIGLYGSSSYKSITNWKSGSGIDANSVSTTQSFVNAAANKYAVDLHLDASVPTAAEAYGAVVTGTGTDIDYDGQVRSTLTPVDLGADAGNFTFKDVASPVINFSPLVNNEITTDRVVTATISDASGVYKTGVYAPRIYFKKFASGTWYSNAGALSSGSTFNGTWQFTISSSTMGGLNGTDSVYYFVVAQDSSFSNNLGSYAGGVEGFDVNNITVYPNPFSYRIKPLSNGTYYVGSGQTYTTLTANDGLFAYLNSSVVSGNIQVLITSDIEEPATNGLAQTVETGTGGYTIRINPDAPVLRSLTGTTTTASSAVIRIEGADRVIVDGSYAGNGQFIRIMNRALNGASLNLLNDADNDTIANVFIEGVNNTIGMLNLQTAATGGTGNDSNYIYNCVFRDSLGTGYITSSGLNKPNTGVFSQGTSTAPNDYNKVVNCQFYNIRYNCLNINSTGGGDYWTYYNNATYTTSTDSSWVATICVQINGGGGHIIRKNSIGGSAPDRSGMPYRFWYSGFIKPIYIASSSTINSIIDSNLISNIATLGSSGVNYNIHVANSGGSIVTVRDNIIGGGNQAWDTLSTVYNVYGMYVSGASNIFGNTIGNMRNVSASSTGYAAGINVGSGGGVISVHDNIVRDIAFPYPTISYTTIGGPVGIYITPGSTDNYSVINNTVYNISSNNNGVVAKGISFSTSSNNVLTVSKNKVYNISANSTNKSAYACGIHSFLTGTNTITNNQISLGANTSERVFGYIHGGTANACNFYNNSIFITGQGDTSSFGIYNASTGTLNAINNIIYNRRTNSSGNARHAAIGSLSAALTAAQLNYNLMVVADTAALTEVAYVGAGWNSFNALYSTKANSNWAERVSVVKDSNLFSASYNNDLHINTLASESWYANGKGLPISAVTDDMNGTIRSSTIANGPSDIGAFEFTTSTTPPSAFEMTAPANSSISDYYFASRNIARINWGSAGTVPSSVDIKYYTGSTAPSPHTSMKSYKAYYSITPSGGSGYDYTIRLSYDSAMFGNLSGSTIARQAVTSTTTSWTMVSTSAANPINGTISSNANLLSSTMPATFTLSDTTYLPPSNATLNVRFFIQGFYDNIVMKPVLFNTDGVSSTNIVDTVTVELHSSASGYPVVVSSKTLLNTSGYATITCSSNLIGSSYYIVVKHRNSVETWSANPVNIVNGTNYDFTSSANQAYGSNQMDLGSGIFAIYSGDINQDGVITNDDMVSLDNDNSNFVNGYVTTDVNGDGVVSNDDMVMVDNNNNNFVGLIQP